MASVAFKAKLEGYRSLAETRDVVLIDPGKQRLRHVRRNGTATGWTAGSSTGRTCA